MKIHTLFFVICMSALALAQTKVATGVIEGVVVDEGGNPVASAQVTTSADFDSPGITLYNGAIPTFTADVHGHFMVTNLVVGHHYKVYAKK